jgi:protein-tyrosine phosphatase
LIDLHSHVLPGIDDGPAALSGSREILDAAIADGITHIAATPHVRSDWPTKPDVMERLVADVRALGAQIEVLPGGELDLQYLETLDDDALRRFGLGGNPNLLLLEFPYAGWPLQLRDVVFQLEVRGFATVLAHPERNPEVQETPARLRELVDAGVFVQLTAASLDGRLGRRAAAAARELLDAGLAHLVASDAHTSSIRTVGMTAAADAVGDRALAEWLTHEVPRALLASEPLPDRPQRRRRTMRLPWHR